MSLSTLRTRVSLLPSGAPIRSQRIADLAPRLHDKTDLTPWYQRDIVWTKEMMDFLLTTIMMNGIIPSILLYKLQDGDKKKLPSHRWECVDGQHRLYTLFHYYHGRAVTLPGKTEWMITWNYEDANKKITHVFFEETEDTKRWIAAHPSSRFDYMSDDERDFFSDFMLEIKEIKDALTDDQRSAMFNALQRGRAVRGSDNYKSLTGIRLIRFIAYEMRWEQPFKEALRNHCYMNPKNYWLHWILRCFLMLNPSGEKDVYDNFKLRDSQISEYIKKNNPCLTSTKEQEDVFVEAVNRFLSFLHQLPAGVKFSPPQFFALFFHLSQEQAGREEILIGHMSSWAHELASKNHKMAWEKRKVGDDDDERESFFYEACEELGRIKIPVEEMPPRKTIPKKIRDRVWTIFFDDLENHGNCYCCNDEITYDAWEAGHILAVKQGGKDLVENLKPVCRCCNRSMGTMNLEEFKSRYHPND
jgi:hypothetical protein